MEFLFNLICIVVLGAFLLGILYMAFDMPKRIVQVAKPKVSNLLNSIKTKFKKG